MSEHEPTSSRRGILRLTVAGLIGVSGWSRVTRAAQDSGGEPDAPLGTTQPGEAQPNGGPMNQSYRDTPVSATGVKNITKVTDQPTSYAPITNPEGITASVQYFDGKDDSYIAFTDIQNQEVINQIEVLPGANPGAWVDGDYLYGNTTNAELRGINGEIKQTFPDNSEGAIALQGEKAYLGTGEGVAEVSKDDLTNYTQHRLIAGANPSALIVIDQGDTIAGYAFRNLFSHKIEEEKTIAEPSIPADQHVSTDGENLFALDRSGFATYKIPKNEGEAFSKIASASFDGYGVYSPPVVSERDDETLLVTGTGLFPGPEGYKVRAYSFDGGAMREIWSQEVEGSGNDEGVEQIVGVGDSVIVGAENLYGFNMNTGEELFEEDIDGKPGMPHGKYVPVGTPDGTYVLEMETGELSGQKPPQDPPEEPPSEPPQNGTDPGNGNNTNPDPPQEPPMNQTDPGRGNNTDPDPPEEPPMNQTDPRNGNTTGPSNGTGQSNISNGSASSDGSGPGFGLVTGLAGVAGGAAYAAKRYLEPQEE